MKITNFLFSCFVKMIPPRGCAYIVMIHRQDAFKALQKLSRGSYKVNQKAIKVSEQHVLLSIKTLLTNPIEKEKVEIFKLNPGFIFVYFLPDCVGFEQGDKG